MPLSNNNDSVESCAPPLSVAACLQPKLSLSDSSWPRFSPRGSERCLDGARSGQLDSRGERRAAGSDCCRWVSGCFGRRALPSGLERVAGSIGTTERSSPRRRTWRDRRKEETEANWLALAGSGDQFHRNLSDRYVSVLDDTIHWLPAASAMGSQCGSGLHLPATKACFGGLGSGCCSPRWEAAAKFLRQGLTRRRLLCEVGAWWFPGLRLTRSCRC